MYNVTSLQLWEIVLMGISIKSHLRTCSSKVPLNSVDNVFLCSNLFELMLGGYFWKVPVLL